MHTLDLEDEDSVSRPDQVELLPFLFEHHGLGVKNLNLGGCRGPVALPLGSRGYPDLNLMFSPFATHLPEGLRVGKNLDIHGTLITRLPQGLIVGGSLMAYKTSLTQLPEGLVVGGDIYLGHTSITQVPAWVKMGGCLHL